MAKRKKTNWLLIGLAAFIVVLVGVAIVRQQSKPKGELVQVEKVERRTIREKVSASGKIFPQTEIKISSDVSGEVVELYVAEGDSVVTGQLLAKIDPDAYQSQVERGVAGVNSAKAQLSNARSQIEQLRAQKEQIEAQLVNAREIHRRNERLKKEGVISDADYDASLSNLRALEANLRSADASIKAAQEGAKASEFSVQSAEASLKELRTSLRRTTIYAPAGGIISKLNVEKGERVVGTIQMTGTEMMRIANLNAMEVRVDVSENDVPRVSIGDEVDIEVDAYLDRKFKGWVTQIARSASSVGTAALSLASDQVTNFEVRISIDPASYQDLIRPGKAHPFLPGMSASVEINTETVSNVLSVPIQAVTTRERDAEKRKKAAAKAEKDEQNDDDGEGQAVATSASEGKDLIEVVFVVENDTVKMVNVQTGIQDDSYIQILSGLVEKQEIVIGPYTAVSRKLKQGDRIRQENDKTKDKDKKKK